MRRAAFASQAPWTASARFARRGATRRRAATACSQSAASPPSPRVELEVGTYSIRGSAAAHSRGHTDAAFSLPEYGLVGLTDAGAIDFCAGAGTPRQRALARDGLVHAVVSAVLDEDDEEDDHLRARSPADLLSTFQSEGLVDDLASAWVMRVFAGGAAEVAVVGTCGYVVLRGREVLAAHDGRRTVSGLEESVRGVASRGVTKPRVVGRVLALERGDLVIAATDGLWDNVSEEQLLAFLRPVESPWDATLSIANHTCLATRTSDDPELLSYMLAHLAHNYACNSTTTPFISPTRNVFIPTRTEDDVSVLIALVC